MSGSRTTTLNGNGVRWLSAWAFSSRSFSGTKDVFTRILHANLIPKYSGHLLGTAGKKWLGWACGCLRRRSDRQSVDRRTRAQFGSARQTRHDAIIRTEALENPRVVRLMTVPGIGPVTVASTVLASIGDISRFETPEELSCYFGLTPKVRQSGHRPARHGRISKQGNTHARKMLVEAAWSAKTAQVR